MPAPRREPTMTPIRRQYIRWKPRIIVTLTGIEIPLTGRQLCIRCGYVHASKNNFWTTLRHMKRDGLVCSVGNWRYRCWYLRSDHDKFAAWVAQYSDAIGEFAHDDTNISTILKDYHAEQRRRNELTSAYPPLGMRRVSANATDLVPDTHELAAIRLAKQLYKQGLILSEISRELAAQGYCSRSGAHYKHRTLHNMIKYKESVHV